MDSHTILEISEFDKAIRAWWQTLNGRVESIKKAGKYPVIIALSRKMPRFFKWVSDVFFSSENEKKQYSQLMNKCEFTTEHGLPFLINVQKIESYEFIIVDDTIVHGDTIRRTIDSVFALTGKKPYLSAVFVSDAVGAFVNANDDDILFSRHYRNDEITACLKFVAKCNMEVALPIDMEYPILYQSKLKNYSCNSSEYYLTWMMGNLLSDNGAYEQYRVDYDEILSSKICSYTLILRKEAQDSYNNDFAKIRFFDRESDDRIKIVSFAPNVLSNDSLWNKDLFENNCYREIWTKTLSFLEPLAQNISKREDQDVYILDKAKDRLSCSLAVWANYLFSLSTILRNWKDMFIKNGQDNFTILLEDLELILGPSLAKSIKKDLDYIVSNYKTSQSERKSVILPSSINPSSVEEEYEIEKYRAVLGNNKIADVLENIFKLQDCRTGFLVRMRNSIPYVGRLTYGETFASLISLLMTKPEIEIADAEKEVNKWIDQHVDQGQIVPKYERVKNSAQKTFWKRYFMAGTVPF